MDLFTSRKKALYLMIGSPVSQVKSPGLFNRYFQEKGLDAEMLALDVEVGRLPAFFEALRKSPQVKGCIVTVPHKQAATAYLDEQTERSRLLDAVNVMAVRNGQLMGDMVDGLGFIAALAKHRFTLKGKRVALIGVGAAGSALALEIASREVSQLAVHDIDGRRLEAIRQLLHSRIPGSTLTSTLKDLEHKDLVINASTTGMLPEDGLPVPVDALTPPCLVADLVTKPRSTRFLEAASARGCELLYGEEMVHGQFALIGRVMGLEIEQAS